jgi:hypothetical protein
MALLAAAAPPPPPPPSGGPSGLTGAAPAPRFCTRHYKRLLSEEEVGQGHVRCAECREKSMIDARKRRKGPAGLSVDVTTGVLVEPRVPSPTPYETASLKRGHGHPPRMPLSGLASSSTLSSALTFMRSSYAPIAPAFQPPGLNVHFPAPPAPPRVAFSPAPAFTVTDDSRPSVATPTFLPRGQHSGDTLETATARRERDDIRRDHRVRQRAGEDVSDTPDLSELRARAEAQATSSLLSAAPPTSQLDARSAFTPYNYELPSVPSPLFSDHTLRERARRGRRGSIQTISSRSPSRSISPSQQLPYFLCVGCDYPRGNSHLHTEDLSGKHCDYCMDESDETEQEPMKQLVWCIPEGHEAPFEEFFSAETDELYFVCQACQAAGVSDVSIRWSQSSPMKRASQPQASQSAYGSSLYISSSLPPRPSSHRPGPAERERQANINRMGIPDPTINIDSEGWQDQQALSDPDWELLQNFHARMDKEEMETCSRCNERWFKMRLNGDNVCKDCIKVDRDVDPDEPFMFTYANLLDPGPVPGEAILPKLSQVEEMLISRVHCFVEVRQVRGQQYKYRGHIVNFLNNTAKIFNTLPLLPQDLDIIIIRPKGWNQDARMVNQTRKDFRVRKAVIKTWLHYLRSNHPAYHPDVLAISDENLDALDDDAFVDDEMVIHEIDEEAADNDDQPRYNQDASKFEDEDLDPEVVGVPDLHAENDELAELQTQLRQSGAVRNVGRQPRRKPHMSMPTPDQTPLSEFNKSHPLLSWAFPSLYPQGRAEFVDNRMREATYPEYVRHLLLYKDGRFAQHPRWRYVVFNTMMRTKVNEKAGFFVNRLHPEGKDLTVDDLRQAFQDQTDDSEQLINSITRYAGKLRGTRPYWAGEMKCLEAMVRQLLCPSLFVTFSAADYHWDSLMRLLPNYQHWLELEADPKARSQHARDAVRDNPLIVAYHFVQRLRGFQDEVLKPKFNVVDYWHRYEWQSRGSTHSHGLYWCEGAPRASANMSDELKDYFACFWGMHVTAFNPEPNSGPRPHSEPSILQVPGEFMVNNAISLSSVVNRVQGHIHSRYYCLKTNKNTKVDECRFHLPDELRDKAKLDKHPAVGRDWLWFYPIRNDGMINKYNRLISMAWQANTDISPCTDPKAVLEYVVKYASKAEKKSPAYRDLAGTLIPFVNENRPFQSLVTKMMNKLIGDRDYSAQEVCHYLLDLPLKHATRAFISVDLRPEDQHSHLYRLERDETRRGLSVLEKYKERNAEDEEVTYIDFLKRYSHQRPYSKRP